MATTLVDSKVCHSHKIPIHHINFLVGGNRTPWTKPMTFGGASNNISHTVSVDENYSRKIEPTSAEKRGARFDHCAPDEVPSPVPTPIR